MRGGLQVRSLYSKSLLSIFAAASTILGQACASSPQVTPTIPSTYQAPTSTALPTQTQIPTATATPFSGYGPRPPDATGIDPQLQQYTKQAADGETLN